MAKKQEPTDERQIIFIEEPAQVELPFKLLELEFGVPIPAQYSGKQPSEMGIKIKELFERMDKPGYSFVLPKKKGHLAKKIIIRDFPEYKITFRVIKDNPDYVRVYRLL